MKNFTAMVLHTKMNKTVMCVLERTFFHPKLKTYFRDKTKVMAHDELETCNPGDRVSLRPCAPFSKNKAMVVDDIIARNQRLMPTYWTKKTEAQKRYTPKTTSELLPSQKSRVQLGEVPDVRPVQ
eukprot:JP448404.1.p2 GENE.JP448404.1~~JP448404.1.p2  ORF type:complete len:134 (+),score=36.12 JP448404.1:28-402(+)